MRGCGKERVILALISAPKLRINALLSVLPIIIKQEIKREAYTIYITDALKMISESTAKQVGGNCLSTRYIDIIDDNDTKPKSANEIISGLEFSGAIIIERKEGDK